jgi:hypothetical protein
VAQDPFDVLGIAADATLAEARAAYRRMVALFHPDHLQGMRDDVRVEGERRLREATEAMDAIRAGYRTRNLDGLVGPNGLSSLFGSRRAKTGNGSYRASEAPGSDRVTGRTFNAQVRQVGDRGLHADWSGRHAAALWTVMRRDHGPNGPIFQVEWGAYECTLPGSKVRDLLGAAWSNGGDWRVQPLETFELAGRRLIGTSAPQPPGSRDLGWLSDQFDERADYLVTAEVF